MCDRVLLSRGLDKLGIRISDDRIENVVLYCRELRKWNKRINLVARNTSAAEILEKHFLDSLTLLPLLKQYGGPSTTLLDVGTGAGFPGLVLAAVIPELSVTLVEPRQKRVSFLRHLIRILSLTNVRVIAERLEDADMDAQEFTFITSRAVADLDPFLAMIQAVARPATRVIAMRVSDDPGQWPTSPRARIWQLVASRKIQLPFSGAPRLLLVLRKK